MTDACERRIPRQKCGLPEPLLSLSGGDKASVWTRHGLSALLFDLAGAFFDLSFGGASLRFGRFSCSVIAYPRSMSTRR